MLDTYKYAFLQKTSVLKVKGVKKEGAMMEFLSEMKTKPINTTSMSHQGSPSKGFTVFKGL